MSKASEIVILCEDKAHDVFVRRFLKKGWGVKERAIRVVPYPCGKGSGKKHVEDKIGQETEAFRSRYASTVLVVVRDADEDSVKNVQIILSNKIVPPRQKSEQIAYIIPKWHIQTWIAYLAGEVVDESDGETYKKKNGTVSETKEGHEYVDRLADHCRNNRDFESPPDSLKLACEEFKRIRGVLQRE